LQSFAEKHKTTIEKSDVQALSLSNDLALKNYQNAELLLDHLNSVVKKVMEIHFGVRSGLISDDFMESVIVSLRKKFGSLTAREIEFAFSRVEIKKEDFRQVTLREFLLPVQIWYQKKAEIENKIEAFEREQREKEEGIRKAAEFKNQSIVIYNESRVSGKWCGTIFNANAIARDIAKKIDQSVKNKLWTDAQKAKRLQDVKAEENPNSIDFKNIGFTAERIFGELIVKEGIKQKIDI